MKTTSMKKINFSISLVTGVFIIYVALCSPFLSVPFAPLFGLLLLLQAGLIWMVLTILKNGSPSTHTFDERFYDDADKGPH